MGRRRRKAKLASGAARKGNKGNARETSSSAVVARESAGSDIMNNVAASPATDANSVVSAPLDAEVSPDTPSTAPVADAGPVDSPEAGGSDVPGPSQPAAGPSSPRTPVQRKATPRSPVWSASGSVSVIFRVSYETAFGEELVVVGSSPRFGAWNVAAAPRMVYTTNGQWILNTGVPVADLRVLEYKYAVIRPNGEPTWESSSNRTLLLPRRDLVVVDDVWNNPQNLTVRAMEVEDTKEAAMVRGRAVLGLLADSHAAPTSPYGRGTGSGAGSDEDEGDDVVLDCGYTAREVSEWSLRVTALDLESRLRDEAYECVAAVAGGRILAYGIVHGETGAVTALYTDHDEQGKGLGTRLLAVLEDRCKAHGHGSLAAHVTNNAIDFFAGLGWIVDDEAGPPASEIEGGRRRFPLVAMRKDLG